MTLRAALTWLLIWALVASAVAVGVIVGTTIVRAAGPAASSSQHAGPRSLSRGMTPEVSVSLPVPDVAARSGLPERVTPAPTTDGQSRRIAQSSSPMARGPVAATSQPRTAASLRGLVTWYRHTAGEAAAGPDLRRALGPGWRGRTVVVRVAPDGPGLAVTLTDFCACADRNGRPTLVDLDVRDFALLAPPSWGVLEVEVTT